MAWGSDSISIVVENPFHNDLDSVVGQKRGILFFKGAALNGVDVRGLIPKMIRSYCRGAGEDALLMPKEFVYRGFKEFSLAYVEEDSYCKGSDWRQQRTFI